MSKDKEKKKELTGTERIFSKDGALKMPDPVYPTYPDQGGTRKKEAKESLPQDYRQSPEDIVKSLSTNAMDSKIYRLTVLARKNRDVAWLLDQYKGHQDTKKTKKETKESK